MPGLRLGSHFRLSNTWRKGNTDEWGEEDMTEEELARFALVLKECERLRAMIAQEGETCLIAQSGRTQGASSTLPMMPR